MIMRRAVHFVYWVGAFLSAVAVSFAANVSAPVDFEGPVPIEFRVFIIDVDEINSAEQNFTANVYVQASWKDSRLAHEQPGVITVPLAEIWHPQMQFVNQQRLWRTFSDDAFVMPDGTVTFRQRVWGQFSQPLGLRDFPFDHHTFNVIIVAAGVYEEDVEFVLSSERPSGISTNLSVADWDVREVRVEPQGYTPMPGDVTIAGFVASFTAYRDSGYFVFKVIVPLVLILAMSWVVFWIDPSESGTQIGVATTTMLTLIAYRFAMGSNLPNISYLTRMDYFILASTILVFLSLMEVMLTSHLAKTGRLKQARWIDWCARFLVPTVFVAVTLHAFIL